ncbi:LytR/AlgR family response regulator transcription factor [Bacillus thuringiensis]|uniref:LytR/AlgR family response regulator transcription factor n=1 Tax=Bacillus thuringiensis TaxID=1428 RepID=UPI000BF6C11C|nr:LytTR family DNA-binding domain-containing protein [Bacillus thuringiensis]PFN36595.1 DNA-binding response regulator [Bacillus thuringiensis]
MLKIFVCEDDERQLNDIVDIIKKYIYMQDYDIEFEMATSNPDEILNHIQNNQTTGLYFLDVDLKHEINGIALGAKIRKYDSSGKIVFITTHAELAYLTFLYKVEAMDYIPKDDMLHYKGKIRECIDVAHERHLNDIAPQKKAFIVKTGDKQIKINIDDIQFIESSTTPHKLVLHMENRQIEFYGKIKEMDKISQDFYRCHQSYVVNINNIEEIKQKDREIIMKDGEVCYSSTRYLKGLLKLMDKVLKDNSN